MEQKDIDRLLVCRKAIDDHRVIKVATRDTYASATTADKALKYAKMQDAFATSRDTYLRALSDNGFDSLEDFISYNDALCVQAMKECTPLYSLCDRCEGIKDTPPCVAAFGSGACFYTGITDENFYISSLRLLKQVKYTESAATVGVYKFTDIDNSLSIAMPKWAGGEIELIIGSIIGFGTCPDGRGFRNKINSHFPFDISWK
jgi:hypothetical protein